MLRRLVPVLAATLVPAGPVLAQREGPAKPDAAEIVSMAADMIRDNYVFPKIGETTATMLLEKLETGRYEDLSAQEMAQALTEDLRGFTTDLHFGATWNPPGQRGDGLRPAPRQGRPDPFGVTRVERLNGNIGYMDLRGFFPADQAADTLHAAMRLLAGSDALIFDLRKNGGGDPETVQLICSYLFDPSEQVLLNSLYFRPTDETTEFWTLEELPGEAMPDTPVFVLTSPRTFSAAEEFTYNLKTRGRATIVGQTTGGGAHPVDGFDLAHGIVLRIPVGRAINPITETNWEGTGVSPDVAVDAPRALDTAIALALAGIVERNPQAHEASWALLALNAANRPLELDVAEAAEFVGVYGAREIRLEDGDLHYQRHGVSAGWLRLVPVDADTFLVDGDDGFKMVFERNPDGEITGIHGHYLGGPSDYSARSPGEG